MEKINYAFILNKFYPDCVWERTPETKGYQYDAYVWAEDNSIEMPSKADLDSKWEECKRETFAWKEMISQRNALLRESDKYVLSDYPHTSEELKHAWISYRQQLRDLTQTTVPTVNEHNEVVFDCPQKPE